MKTRYSFFLLCSFLLSEAKTFAQAQLPSFDIPTRIETLNSNAEESLPLPFSQNNNIYFVRTYLSGSMKERKKGQEVWHSSKENDIWSSPTNHFKEINDDGNNAIVGVSEGVIATNSAYNYIQEQNES